jgi:hypothetical protein
MDRYCQKWDIHNKTMINAPLKPTLLIFSEINGFSIILFI